MHIVLWEWVCAQVGGMWLGVGAHTGEAPYRDPSRHQRQLHSPSGP